MAKKYTCAICKGVFDKVTPEDEALAELKEFFGDIPVDECEIVCDDCWEKIRPDKFGLELPVIQFKTSREVAKQWRVLENAIAFSNKIKSMIIDSIVTNLDKEIMEEIKGGHDEL